MRKAFLVLLWVVWSAPAQTRLAPDRQRQDEQWARKSGLAAAEVRALRLAVGISDDTDGVILMIDGKSLKSRNHILVTEASQGHCMKVHVMEPSAESYKEVWSLNELPGRGWPTDKPASRPGSGICSQGPRSPVVRVGEGGRLEVELQVLADPFQQSIPTSGLTYFWNGKTYAPAQGQ